MELVGDDNFCTNPAIITRAIERGIANASLIKLNQIGTVTETLQAMAICRDAGYRPFVSHRSGETEDSFIADLTVGTLWLISESQTYRRWRFLIRAGAPQWR